MSRSSALILLGILTILAPFSGLPVAMRSLLAAIFGACILGIGFAIRAHEVRNSQSLVGTPTPEPTPEQTPPSISSI